MKLSLTSFNALVGSIEAALLNLVGPSLAGLAVNEVQILLHNKLRDLLYALIPGVLAKMKANRWFPLPCQRPPYESHTLPGAVLYYLWEALIFSLLRTHGIDNEAAGLLQLGYQTDFTTAVAGASTAEGQETAYLTAGADAIAQLVFPVDAPVPAVPVAPAVIETPVIEAPVVPEAPVPEPIPAVSPAVSPAVPSVVPSVVSSPVLLADAPA